MSIYGKRRTGGGRTSGMRAVGIVLVPAIILIAGFVWLQIIETRYEYGPDLCLKNRPLDAHSVLIVDRTDFTRSESQLDDLLRRIKSELSPFERFSIYTITADHARLPTPLFSMCNPGTADDVDVLARSPARVQKKFDQEFAGPIEKLVRRSAASNPSQLSPIIETLQTLSSIESFADSTVRRRIYLFSDMLQNTEYSHYRHSIRFTDFARAFPGLARIDLERVDIRIEYVRRENAGRLQGPEHLRFWRDFFVHAGARYHGISG